MAEPKRYKLKVPEDKRDYALRHGAQLDGDTGSFYVLGDIPEPLEEFSVERVERTPLRRRRPPNCPGCNAPMVKRTSSLGSFWGCPNYPRCRKTRPCQEKQGDFDQELFEIPSGASAETSRSERATYSDRARVAQRALDIFGEERFKNWLFGPNSEIGNLPPADLLGCVLN